MRPEDILAADTSDWIAVLPLGAHEQHGPHLPFETDAIIASGVAARLAASLEPEIPATFLAVEPVGYSVEHMDYQGSLTLTFEEALEKWIGMGEKLAELGIRKFLLLNAHGGNSPLMTIVATELRIRCGTLCVATSWTRFVEAGKTITAQEKAIGIHGGDLETSVMLALAPNRVKMDLAQDFGSFQEVLMSDYKHLRAYGPHAFGWKMQDLNPLGVTGNACLASLERGEAYLAEAVDGLKELMLDIHAFDLKSLK
ncbi:MAG: creatininase family protein [Pseudomonadota bacterium]